MDQSWKDASLSFEERTKILVDQMTLEKKRKMTKMPQNSISAQKKWQ